MQKTSSHSRRNLSIEASKCIAFLSLSLSLSLSRLLGETRASFSHSLISLPLCAELPCFFLKREKECVTVCAGDVFALTVGNYKFCSIVDS